MGAMMPYTVPMLASESRGAMLGCPERYTSKPGKLVAALNDTKAQNFHTWAVNEFTKEWDNFPPLKMGGQPDDWKKQYKKRLSTCYQRVKESATTQWKLAAVAVGALAFLAFGFTGVALLILGAVFSWFVETWLDNNVKITEARTAAGYA